MELMRVKKSRLSMDMAPLIDIVFQLLIFFILTASLNTQILRVNLPHAVYSDAPQQGKIVVAINKAGEIFINEQKTMMSMFEEDIKNILSTRKERAIHLQGDHDMPYRYFVEIMGMAKRAGADQINIVHQKN